MATKFRETQWFKLGYEEPAAQDDEAPSAKHRPIEDRYTSDGVTAEDTAQFGLHTGRTEHIRLDFDRKVDDEVRVETLVREMKRSRGKLVAIGATTCAVLAAFTLYFV